MNNQDRATGPIDHVRVAWVADAASIGSIQARAWAASYGASLPRNVLDGLDAAGLAGEWAAALRRPPTSAHRVLVALTGTEVVGFAALAPSDDPDAAAGRDADLAVLAVDPDHYGCGHGSRLLSAVADTARADGFTRLTTWVMTLDDRLRSFLESAGWAADGAHRELAATDDQAATIKQVRLHTALEMT